MRKHMILLSLGLVIGLSYAHSERPEGGHDDIVIDPIIQKDLIFERRGCAEYGAFSIDNIRGAFNTKAYDCQDRACVVTVRKPTVLTSDVLSEVGTFVTNPGVFVAGVFDGHCTYGDKIALLSRFYVVDYFKKFFENGTRKILYQDFLILGNTVQTMLSENKLAHDGGTTGCFCMFEGPLAQKDSSTKLYRAVFCNVGDSRAIVISGSDVVFSTVDHTPKDSSELARIKQAGGWISGGYVYGPGSPHGFVLSRSWGDLSAHTNGVISSTPDIYSFGVPTLASNSLLKIKEETKYLIEGDIIVCATDGLWDVLTTQEVADYIYIQRQKGGTLQTISEELVNKARSGDNNAHHVSRDDITIVIVQL